MALANSIENFMDFIDELKEQFGDRMNSGFYNRLTTLGETARKMEQDKDYTAGNNETEAFNNIKDKINSVANNVFNVYGEESDEWMLFEDFIETFFELMEMIDARTNCDGRTIYDIMYGIED